VIVMPADNNNMFCGYLAGKYEGRIAWLLTAHRKWKNPKWWMEWALDNGAFPAWENKTPFDFDKFYQTLDQSRKFKRPKWVVVPDVVADREGTLKNWFLHSPRVATYGYPLAFAAQDGMTPDDIPPNADVVFIGGTTEWKWRNLRDWTTSFPRIHVGRVGSERMLWMAHEAGAESCDSSGWFREGDSMNRLGGLVRYLDESTHGKLQHEFNLA
jgi:hypothetical protein